MCPDKQDRRDGLGRHELNGAPTVPHRRPPGRQLMTRLASTAKSVLSTKVGGQTASECFAPFCFDALESLTERRTRPANRNTRLFRHKSHCGPGGTPRTA